MFKREDKERVIYNKDNVAIREVSRNINRVFSIPVRKQYYRMNSTPEMKKETPVGQRCLFSRIIIESVKITSTEYEADIYYKRCYLFGIKIFNKKQYIFSHLPKKENKNVGFNNTKPHETRKK